MDELEDRVSKFNSLSLPGQPTMMHMGTSYLVNDLWREIKRLRIMELVTNPVQCQVLGCRREGVYCLCEEHAKDKDR